MIFWKKKENVHIAKLKALRNELTGDKQKELLPFKSDITDAMVKEQLQKELDIYSMKLLITRVTLMKTEPHFSGFFDSDVKEYRDFERQTWSIDIGNERFHVANKFVEKEQKIIFDAERWAKDIILQTEKKLSSKARSLFGGATVIDDGGEGNIFLKMGYCPRCKKKAPLISRCGVVARNYVDMVPEVCPYCLFKKAKYDIKISKIKISKELKINGS